MQDLSFLLRLKVVTQCQGYLMVEKQRQNNELSLIMIIKVPLQQIFSLVTSKKMRINAKQHLQKFLFFKVPRPDSEDEGIQEKLLGSGAVVGVLLQAAAEKVPNFGGATCDGFRRLAGNHDHRDDRLHPQVARLSLAELDENDSKGPDVHALGVLLLADEFGCHPGRSSRQLLGGGFLLGELQGVAEVPDLDVSVLVYQDVVALEVAVQLAPAVDSVQTAQYFAEDVGDHTLVDLFAVMGDEVVECAVVHVLDEHEEGVVVVVGKVVLDYVAALANCHHCDLLLQLLQVLLVLQRDQPNSELPPLILMRARLVHLAHAPLPDLMLEPVLQRRLRLPETNLLQPALEFARAQQLPLELGLVDLVAVVGDHVEKRAHVSRQLRDHRAILDAAPSSLALTPEVLRRLQDLPLLLPYPRFDELSHCKSTSSLRCRLRTMNSTISGGSSNSGRISSGRLRVGTVLLGSMSKGRSNLSHHSCGTPSSRPVSGFFRILMPSCTSLIWSRLLISLFSEEEETAEETWRAWGGLRRGKNTG